MAEEMSDFIFGRISQSAVSRGKTMFHITPGLKLVPGVGTLGQKYLTPQAVGRGSDTIIVGRDIYEASNRLTTAANYKKVGYKAFCTRVIPKQRLVMVYITYMDHKCCK